MKNNGGKNLIAEDLDGPSMLELDIIEHLKSPEDGLKEITNCMYEKMFMFYASTRNVGYLPLIIKRLLGYFNYVRRRILDKTHKRLFNINSFKRLFEQENLEIIKVNSFGLPKVDLIRRNSKIIKSLDQIHWYLSRARPGMFVY